MSRCALSSFFVRLTHLFHLYMTASPSYNLLINLLSSINYIYSLPYLYIYTMNEDLQWEQACDWVRDQVLVSFRHRAIISRISQSSSDITIEEPAEMLQIELPRELTEVQTDPEQQHEGSVAQLMQQVVARLKHLEEMECIEEQVRVQKEHRRKFHIPKMGRSASPQYSSKHTDSAPSSRRRSRQNSSS